MTEFRDDLPTCPRCPDTRALDASGRRLACAGCSGILVPIAEVEALLAEMNATREASNRFDPMQIGKAKIIAPPPPSEPRAGTLACPRCRVRMDEQVLCGETVDRCATHGYWFDRDELAKVLQRTAEGMREHQSLWYRLTR